VAIFESGGYVPLTTSVGTVPSIIFNSGSVTSGRDVIVLNTGANTVYVGGGTAGISAANAFGIPLTQGQQMVLQGTAVTLYANTSVVGQTSTVIAGLGTLVSVA
jgi:hypothetical protein